MLNAFKIANLETENKKSGISVVICEEGAVAGLSCRGAAPASREFMLLKSENTVDKIHAVVLSGGSAFGLSAASGVMDALAERNIGFQMQGQCVPIVVGASIFDLNVSDGEKPNYNMGYKAVSLATVNNFKSGMIGVGAGASVGKLLGVKTSQKTGMAVSSISMENGLEICVISVVNALGDVFDDNGNILKGLFVDGKHIQTKEILKNLINKNINLSNFNTTLSIVLTNAVLTKVECNRLADVAHDGFARCINPVHTKYDGDTIFVLSSCDVFCDETALDSIVCELIKDSIQKAAMVE